MGTKEIPDEIVTNAELTEGYALVDGAKTNPDVSIHWVRADIYQKAVNRYINAELMVDKLHSLFDRLFRWLSKDQTHTQGRFLAATMDRRHKLKLAHLATRGVEGECRGGSEKFVVSLGLALDQAERRDP